MIGGEGRARGCVTGAIAEPGGRRCCCYCFLMESGGPTSGAGGGQKPPSARNVYGTDDAMVLTMVVLPARVLFTSGLGPLS